jgi:hypothetical protein
MAIPTVRLRGRCNFYGFIAIWKYPVMCEVAVESPDRLIIERIPVCRVTEKGVKSALGSLGGL